MDKYEEFKRKQQLEFNKLPVKYAFQKRSVKKMLKEWNIAEDDFFEKVWQFKKGCFCLWEDAPKIKAYFRQADQKLKEAMKDTDFAYHAFLRELYNTDYSGDICEPIEAVGLEVEYVLLEPELVKALKQALETYKNRYDGEED